MSCKECSNWLEPEFDEWNKREVTLWSNNSREANDLEKALEEKGLKVKIILTASTLPVIKEGKNYMSGAGTIKSMYGLFEYNKAV